MKEKVHFLLILVVWCSVAATTVSGQISQNMTLMANWDDNALPASSGVVYNDVWGYAAAGREYAILGTIEGFYIFDVTVPTNPVVVTFRQGGSTSSIWRDFKTYGPYLYAVSDQGAGSSLQIYDLRGLPLGINKVYDSQALFSEAHNIFIEEASGRMYVAGSPTQPNGVLILDIASDPTNPSLLASFTLGAYVHDVYSKRDTMFAFFGGNGIASFDFADLTNPSFLAQLFTYQEAGYAHSGYASEDFKTIYWCDETHDTGIKVGDISNPVNINVTGTFRSTLEAPLHTNSMAHNPFVKDSLLYIAYYHDGLQVYNISDPQNPIRTAYYDTYPGNTDYSGLKGAWGVYPYLPSGHLLVSDTENGLFILSDQTTFPVEMSDLAAEVKGETVELSWKTHSEVNNDFFVVERSADGNGFEEIAKVDGKGNSSVLQAYSFTDQQPLRNKSWYRLRQVDMDGLAVYSDAVEVLRPTGFAVLGTYPSPMAQGALLRMELAHQEAGAAIAVTVLDMNGRIVHQQDYTCGSAGTLAIELPSQDWSAGNYVARIVSGGEVLSERIVIQ